ncbi:MAG: hypothetical protein AAF281_11095 [Pseudomonadota bacterium]
MIDLKQAATATLLALTPLATAAVAEDELDLRFAGALEFAADGTLFVGDNYQGAIFAFAMTGAVAPDQVMPVNIGDIDVKIADRLGVPRSAVAINDMAVHPISAEIYISVSRIGNFESAPALIKVAQDGTISVVDLTALPFQKQALAHFPDQDTTFRPRGLGQMPPLVRDMAKGEVTLSSLAIMDMAFYEGELFVSGVAFDNFLSTLRRIPYPFTDVQEAASVEMYHISHDQFETRAPIRAMTIQEVDGAPTLVAAYTCSPVVLIGLDEIVDGAKISARTIMDYGNGQPIDMLTYSLNGAETLFLTSNSRSPHIIPVESLSGARAYTKGDLPDGGKSDTSPIMPVGDTGKTVMFDGMSLQIDNLGDALFVSLTRDLYTGSLNMDSNFNGFPNRLHNLVAEFDFPQYWADK